MRASILVPLGAALLAGCESDTEIIARLVVVSDPIYLVDSPGYAGGPATSVGVLDDRMLVTWIEPNADGDTALNGMPFDLFLQWHELDGARIGVPENLGPTSGYRTRWVAHEGALVGLTFGDPLDRLPHVWDPDRVWLLRAEAGVPTAATPVPINPPTPPRPDLLQIWIHNAAGAGAGLYTLPTAIVGTGAVSGFVSIPSTCLPGVNFGRMFAVRHTGAPAAEPIPLTGWTTDPCGPAPMNPHEVGNLWLFPLSSGDLGVTFRPSGALYSLHYATLAPDTLLPRGPAVRIADTQALTTEVGFQSRAAIAPGGRVIFDDRYLHAACHRLRRMDEDGTDISDTPFQLPCTRLESAAATPWLELASVSQGVVVVWPEWTPTSNTVRATLVTRDGRRGSNIVDVSPPDAWASPESPAGDLVPFVAAEGDLVAVGWTDWRPEASGAYVRLLRVEP